MKSFGKTFRTFLAMSLVLCMVMSFVTVSADTVTLSTPTIGERNNEGYYEVKYTVSNLPEGGSATILVHEGAAIDDKSIEYANQVVAEEGKTSVEFTMLLGNGTYNVLAGGTGLATAAKGTVKVNDAPVVTLTAEAPIKDDAEIGTVVASYTATDANETLETSDLTLSDSTNFEFGEAGKIVTKAVLGAGEYPLTLTATDSVGDSTTSSEITIVVEESIAYVTANNAGKVIVAYGSSEAEAKAALPSEVTTDISGVMAKVTEWTCDTTYSGDVETTYTFTGALEALEGNYKLTNVTIKGEVEVKDSRTVVTVDEYTNSFPIGYNGTYDEPVIKLLDKDNNDVTNVAASITKWAIAGDKEYSAIVPGTYTFKATITLNDSYKFVDDEVITTSKDVYYTVTVTDERPTITDIEYNSADIEVKYGTEQKDIKFPAVTFVGCDEDVKLSDWVAVPEYDATTPGEYTFTAKVDNTENNDYIFAVEEAVTVKVIVGSNVYVMTEGEDTLGEETAYAVSGFDKAMDAVNVTGGTLTITGGTYDGGTTPYGGLGNTAVYAYGEGTRVVIKDGYFSIKGLPQKDGKYDEGHIDLIYAKAGATIEISGGTFDASGDYVWGVNVHDKEPGTIVITGGTFIGWDPANPGFVGLDKDGNEFVGKVETYLAEGYTTELIGENTWKVVEKKTVIKNIKCDTEAIEVAYGTEPTLPEIFLVDEDGNEIPVSDVEWNKGGFSATTPGVYTFTATVDVTDTKEYKFEVEEGSNVISVEVTVASNVYVAEAGKESTISEGTYTVTEFGTPIDAVYASGEGTVLNITGGTFDGGTTPYGGLGNTAVYAYGEGTRVVIKDGYFSIKGLPKKDGKYDEGHIDLIYAKAGATIEISGGTFDASGDYVWGVNVHDKEPGTIIITGGTFIGWDPANPGFVGLDKDGNEFVGKVETYLAEGYTTELIGENTWKVIEKPTVNVIEPIVVYLLDGCNDKLEKVIADKKADGTIPESLDAVGVKDAITNIKWPNDDEAEMEGWWNSYWPPAGDDPVVIYALSRDVDDSVQIDDSIMPSIKFIPIPKEFDFKVNGFDGNTVITKKGEPIELSFEYDERFADLNIKYFYQITENGIAPSDDAWIEVEGDTTTLDVLVDGEEHGISRRVSAKAKVEGYDLAVKKAYVYRSTSLIEGSIRLASEGLWHENSDSYSAFRVNRNRPLEVKVKLNAKNGAAKDFSTGTAKAVIEGTELVAEGTLNASGEGTLVFNDISSVATNGTYKIVFTYTETGAADPEFEISRTTNITDKTLWYTEFSIDGINRGGIRVGKNLGFVYKLAVDETNPSGKFYTGYEFIPYDTPFDVYAGTNEIELFEQSGGVFEKEFTSDDLKDYSGTYSLYALANLTADQGFYDFKAARTVYVRSSVTNAFNLNLNGSTVPYPSSNDGTLVIVPHLGGIKLEDARDHSFDLTLKYTDDGTLVDISSLDIIGGEKDVANGIIKGIDVEEGVTIKGLNELKDKYITATVNVYYGDKVDATVTKAFHVKYIKVAE